LFGLGGRRQNALTLDDVRCVISFIMHFTDQQGFVLPGRVPGYARDDIKVGKILNAE
jgi:hypothetical protein